jgi:enamine deaminase RidA (YjgF/YER057c/UK114 family)
MTKCTEESAWSSVSTSFPSARRLSTTRFITPPLSASVKRSIYPAKSGRDERLNVISDNEAQIVQAFENLRRVVESAGATLNNFVDLTTFHTDMRDLGLFMKVKDRYLIQDFPAWTAVGVSALGGVPGLIVEIKAIAVLRQLP